MCECFEKCLKFIEYLLLPQCDAEKEDFSKIPPFDISEINMNEAMHIPGFKNKDYYKKDEDEKKDI